MTKSLWDEMDRIEQAEMDNRCRALDAAGEVLQRKDRERERRERRNAKARARRWMVRKGLV